MKNTFQLFVDTGGTFTDCIGIDATGKQYRRKVLSNSSLRGTIAKVLSATTLKIKENWNLDKDILRGFSFRLLSDNYAGLKIASYDLESGLLHLNREMSDDASLEGCNFEITSHEEAPVLGARLITQTSLDEDFPDLTLKLGSTKGTNALLERKGAKTLFLVTKGFKDLLEIGNQARPDIFALNVKKRQKLTSHIIEVKERIDASGNILQSIDREDLAQQLSALDKDQIESVAISLMNAYCNPVHEAIAKELVQDAGFQFISVFYRLKPTDQAPATFRNNGGQCLPVAHHSQLRQSYFTKHR